MKKIFLILLLSLLILYPGCEPGGHLIVKNDLSEEIKVYQYDHSPLEEKFYGRFVLGNVPANTRKEVGVIVYTSLDTKYRIEAISGTSGAVVFSRDITAKELIDMKWTITIPPD